MNEQGKIVAVGSDTLLAIGSEVTWCHASSRRRSIGFTTRRGKIIDIDRERNMACVKTQKSGKLQWLPLHRFRSATARSELTEMVMGGDS